MAESFLFSIAESLIAKLASHAYEEASRVAGVYDDLQKLKQTLSYVKAVLLDAEQKQEHHHELREWLRQIKYVFSDAENVLDEVECERLRKQVVKDYGTTKAKVGRFFSSSNPLVFRYKMAQKVKEIRKRLDMVAADRDKFGLQIIDVDRRAVHRREMTYSHVLESDVIGRKHDKEKIIQLLMQHNPNDDKGISVIPIVGLGGLGKTTLAKFVFNDKRITESFPLKMWVCVSDDFDIKQLMIKIINSSSAFGFANAPVGQQNLKELDMDQLANHLGSKLASQKFLLILDDIWNEDRAKWVALRDLILIPMGVEGSKILMTTRSHSIASMMGTVPSHNLKGLCWKDSLSLFVKWAFKQGDEEKYPNLIMIGREIVTKCGGVPLAVRTLGSLLFSKYEIDDWKSLRDNEIWSLPQEKDGILPALKLSYDRMPSYLRQCFALFSLYPKNYEFDSFDVASLWEAAGLLPSPKKKKTLTDVTNQYLCELMSRSFLQDLVDLGTGYLFKIHDLVHDLALYVAQDECLVVNSDIQSIPENVRHLSFVENNMLGKCSIPKSASVKTILCPIRGMGFHNKALLNTWVSKYKYLRILDLSDSTYEILPRSICRLKHLRSLSLQNNGEIKRLPDSICKLQNLQYFTLEGCTKFEALPKGFGRLISLRDFTITIKQSVLLESEIAGLSSLQILQICYCNNIESLFVGIKLPALKALRIDGCSSLQSLQLDFEHFPQLESLIIRNCDELELFEGHDRGIQNSNLRLKLVYLDSLPQLVALPRWLQASANTLQSLWIEDCDQLEVLPEWLSTLSFLKSFFIIDCPKLMSFPNDIHHLTALKTLRIEDCPELCRKCQPQVGEYWPKISHIEQLIIGDPEDQPIGRFLVEEDQELEEEQEEEESFNNS